MTYTGVFEGVWDGVEDLSSDIYGFGKGLVLGLYEIGKGIVTVAGDDGIVYTSHQLPDSIEPDFLKEAADKRVEGYRAAAMQAIKDPMGVAEAITLSFSDTNEDEGVAYVAGNVSTAFIPYVGMAGKSVSLAKVAGKIPNSNLSKVAGSSKVDVAAIVKKHNAFEGMKRGMGEFVQDVKGGMQVAGNSNRVAVGTNGVAGNAVGKVDDVAENGVASVSRSSGPNRAVDDSIVRIKTEVERVDGGKGNKVTGTSRLDYLRNKYGEFTSKELNYRINLRGETLNELHRLKDTGISKKKIGPAFSGVYDKETGKIYYAINNYDGTLPDFHPFIKSKYDSMPQEVIDSYTFTKGAGSHAEIIALNKALKANPNADLDNFVINVIRTGQNRTKPAGMMFLRCPHCSYLTDEFEIITEVTKNAK